MTRNTPSLRIVLAVAIVLVLAVVPAALAGKGGGGGGGNKPPGGGGGSGSTGGYSVAVSPGGPYSYGQQIYVTTNVPTSLNPFIWLRCYQNGTLVGSSDHAAFPGGWYYNWPFTLGGSLSWSGGAADCTVTVVHTSSRKMVTDASTSLHVNA